MALKYTKLTRSNIRNLKVGKELTEHGITFKRLTNGDGRYAINVMVDGQRVHRVIGKESTGVTRNKAEELIEKLKIDARNGRLNLPKGRKIVFKFAEAAKQYLEKLKVEGGKDIEAKVYRLGLHLVPFFKDLPLTKITASDIERYKKHRLAENHKPGTINRELAALSHMLNKTVECKWLEHRPCNIKRFKEEQTRISYLTTEQIKRLIESAKKDQSPVIYAFIVIGLQTSMRLMEILRIRIENIDLAKQTIFIPFAKTGARQQPITKQLADFLRAYIGDETEGWLFPSKTSKTGHMVCIEKPFRRVVENAGLDPKEVIRHTLRHTAITHLVQAGVDLPTVQRISGHKTLQMVVRYSHQNGEHIRSAMDVLEKRYELEGLV